MLPSTPAALAANPNRLLHRRGQGPSLNPWDGLVGAVFDGGNEFITSPNMPVVYLPVPRRLPRTIKLRSDFRYAEDDPVLWPQYFSIKYCHLAAIPRRPSVKNDPLSLLWDDLASNDFTPLSGGVLDETGHPSSTLLADFARIHDPIIKRFRDYRSSTPRDKLNDTISYIAQSLENALQRFSNLPLSFRYLRFTWRDVQRLTLELIAALDYMEVYYPRITGLTAAASAPANAIGAFTVNPVIAQDFHRAGIPIWLIQPFSKLPFTRIDAVVDPRLPHDFVDSRDASPSLFLNFTSLPEDDEKYLWIARNHRTLYQTPKPLSYEAELPRSSHSSLRNEKRPRSKSPRSSASRNPPHKRPKGPNGQKRHRSNSPSSSNSRNIPANNSKADYYWDSPLCPSIPDSWRSAIESADPPEELKRSGSIFPDIALLLRLTSDEKRFTYITNWMRYRQDLISRLENPTFSIIPISSQMWRNFLNFGFTQPDTREEVTASKAHLRRQELLKLLESCISPANLHVAGNPSKSAAYIWHGQQITPDQLLHPRTLNGILWELNELNFRFDLAALDRRHRSLEVQNVWDQVEPDDLSNCFPSVGSLLHVDLSQWNYGLAATTELGRRPFLVSLAHTMSNWEGCPEAISQYRDSSWDQPSSKDLIILENAVASFYIRKFCYYFHRLPAIPLRKGI